MTIKGGYWGRVLCVDLSKGETQVGTFDDKFARKYLGGVGLAARIIYEKVTKNTNPLGPGNVLVFATGPYQATNIASSGRCSVAARSPLTGYWGEANGGGHIGPAIKRAGFDDIRLAFEDVSGEQLEPFFEQWVDQAGAPVELRGQGTRYLGGT